MFFFFFVNSINFQAICTNCDENEAVSYTWSFEHEDSPSSDAKKEIDWKSETSTGNKKHFLVIYKEVFTGTTEVEYTFSVQGIKYR